MPHVIELLTFENAQLLDVAGPLQVFATANDLAMPEGDSSPYDLRVVAEVAQPVTTSGLPLVARPLPDPASPAPQTLVVAGGQGVNAACERPDLVDWLRLRSAGAQRTASVCSGAFLLASAGLLDGRRAVTDWGRGAEFAARFPTVTLDLDPIFLRDGNVWTSAGVTAGIDLALALVEADLGRRTALAIAQQLVVFLKRPGGQAQFSVPLSLQEGDGRFDRLHGFILRHLGGDLSLAVLAAEAGMSARSLSRHYRLATGRTPARAVEEMRLEQARRMLQDGLSVARAARHCGFTTDETMRRAFQRQFGTSPQAYRDRFAG